MLSHDAFLEAVAKVPSHGTDRHAHLLFGLIRWLRPAVCLEVGAAHGFTSCWMARALQENDAERPGERGQLIVIDDYSLYEDAYPMLWHNLGLTQTSEYIAVGRGNSRDENLWPARVDFAYIDGDHSFEGCMSDYQNAAKRGARCIVLHDTVTWWGPRRFADAFETNLCGWGIVECGFDQGLAVLMRKPEKEPVVFTEAEYPSGALEV